MPRDDGGGAVSSSLADDVAAERLLALLANELRMRIVEAVGLSERSLSELIDVIDAAPSAVLTQVAKLRAGRVIVSTRAAGGVIYRLDDPAALALVRYVRALGKRGQLRARPHVRGLWAAARARASASS